MVFGGQEAEKSVAKLVSGWSLFGVQKMATSHEDFCGNLWGRRSALFE